MRRVTNVVRAGYVTAFTHERIEMQAGSVPTDPGHLHIDCHGKCSDPAPARPVFEEGRITIQCLRFGLTCFNAALTAFVEATWAGRRREEPPVPALCPTERRARLDRGAIGRDGSGDCLESRARHPGLR